jgi:hypothetical protein
VAVRSLQVISDRTKSLICITAIVVVALLFMGQSLRADKVFAPLDILRTIPPWSKTELGIAHSYNALASDKLQQYFPMKTLTVAAWRQGVPLWEPRILGGYPIIGDAEAHIFYPATLPYFFMPPTDASDLVVLLHLILAGVGMFAYLRALRLHHLAALLGGMVFMLNSVTTSWVMWDSAIASMIWLPWALWAFELALRPGRFGIASLGAVAVCLTYLGGQLQWSLYALLALALYFMFRLVFPQSNSRRRIVLAALVIGGLGTTLAAIQLLPSLQSISLGNRGQMSFADLTRGLNWSGFLTLWVPKFFGDVTTRYWGSLNYNELVVYVGIVPLLLLFIAFARRIDPRAIFFAGLGLFAAACVAGTEVYRVLSWLPGFAGLTPSRMNYLIVVSCAVLAGFGLDALLRQPVRQRRATVGVLLLAILIVLSYAVARVPHLPTSPDQQLYLSLQEFFGGMWLVFAVGLLVLAFWSPRWRKAAALGLCILTVLDLWVATSNYQRPMPADDYYPTTPGIAFLQSDHDLFRVLSTREPIFEWQLRPSMAAIYGLNDVGGFASVYLQRYVEFLRQIDASGPSVPLSILLGAGQFNSPLVDLLNVKYALSPAEVQAPGWSRVYDADLRIYQRRDPLPRAWIAATAEVITDDATILTRLAQPGFDPRQTVLVEQQPPEPLGTASAEPAGLVSLDQYESNHLALTADMQRDGWLVLSEIFYPGWTATLDGSPVNVYRGDYVLRTIPLPAGRHRIELNFMPFTFVIGAVISLMSIIALLGVVVAARRLDRPA